MVRSTAAPSIPAHVESTAQAIAQLHAEHARQATPLQRVVERLTARAGRPAFVVGLTIIATAWIALNTGMKLFGRTPYDEPPFFWMQGCVGLAALYIATLILSTQRRDDELASRREQLTLQLAILSEKKSAKIIELLEEFRRDLPDMRNRLDDEAASMATPADPLTVLNTVKTPET